MKFALIFSFMVFGMQVLRAQTELSAVRLQEIAKHENVIVHVSALWCLPCVKKLKATSDSLSNMHDENFHHIVVFDRLSFHKEKLNRLNLSGFDSLSIYLIPSAFYPKAFVQINASRKVLKKYLSAIKYAFHSPLDFKDFWFADAFRIVDQNIAYP